MDDSDRPQSGGVVVRALRSSVALLMALVCSAGVTLIVSVCLFLAVAAANQLLVLMGWGWDGFFTSDDPPPSWPIVAGVGAVLLSGWVMTLWPFVAAVVRTVRNRPSRQ